MTSLRLVGGVAPNPPCNMPQQWSIHGPVIPFIDSLFNAGPKSLYAGIQRTPLSTSIYTKIHWFCIILFCWNSNLDTSGIEEKVWSNLVHIVDIL
ncbi:hypothetical protein PAXRUDRAFT_835257 [Paxillus rubicundulus Ve08.2h10]|uniref:Unplaced genomic scaffold scaffold_2519, whole genome shotgun sequence n=1 Tax=Paxillus rubicundulus Ve08.2h10 TaxID=930991 RepID=A0A0D0DFV2_9AGAM|nr:hypothetical protein PAXRUDRAFT_835257 [Paxillus rubicundulus Ve08.2h10]